VQFVNIKIGDKCQKTSLITGHFVWNVTSQSMHTFDILLRLLTVYNGDCFLEYSQHCKYSVAE